MKPLAQMARPPWLEVEGTALSISYPHTERKGPINEFNIDAHSIEHSKIYTKVSLIDSFEFGVWAFALLVVV